MIESETLVIEPLGRRHDRADFSCGLAALDRYLLRQASQDIRRRALDRSAHGHGPGRMLLADAFKRTVDARQSVAMPALIVDAANDFARVIRVLAHICCGHPMAVRVRGPLEQCGQLSALCWLALLRICGVRWMDGYDGLCSVPP